VIAISPPLFLSMDAAVYLAQRSLQPDNLSSSRVQATAGPEDVAGEEQYISTFFCRALYDYQTNDLSSLSFRRGDIIEVLTRLESGWWDGLLGDERGWFPSNYVTVISDQEAEAALSASDYDVTQSSLGDESVLDMAHSMSKSLSQSDRDGDWLEREHEYSSATASQNGSVSGHSATAKHDFWVPQVSADGRASDYKCFKYLITE
jgi:son of sevenless